MGRLKYILLGCGVTLLPFLLIAATVEPVNIPTTNRSITITNGNTFQTVIAAASPTVSTSRQSLTIQNNNTNNDNCWVFIGSAAAAKATSILLGPGGSYQRYYPFVPSDAIQATCTTTADSLYVDTQ